MCCELWFNIKPPNKPCCFISLHRVLSKTIYGKKGNREYQPIQYWNIKTPTWSSNGNQVMSILQVDLKIPGGICLHFPSSWTIMLVGKEASKFSLALLYRRMSGRHKSMGGTMISWGKKIMTTTIFTTVHFRSITPPQLREGFIIFSSEKFWTSKYISGLKWIFPRSLLKKK